MNGRQSLGMILALAGAILAIGVTLWKTEDAMSLWALVPGFFMVGRFAMQLDSRKTMAPIMAGVVALVLGGLVAVAAIFTGTSMVLWALFPVAFLVQYIY